MNNNETPRETLSKRKPLRFWGWGYDHEELTTDETQLIDAMVKTFFPVDLTEVSEPQLDEFDLRPPRFDIPANLSHLLSSSTYDRLVHSYGKSFADTARMFMREVPNPPDAVAFPESEEDISAIMEFAQTNNIAVIPFGGGTSVCGGVEADVGDQYQGTITVDMERFNKIIEVDEVSRTARIQGGMLGPDIDAALKPYGLTLRHFLQSYQFSTLGGWIATRAGGHFATLYTHIDDMVESTRMVTPQGVMQTRRLPGSGAGPSPDRMVIGSEGILGIITEASVRLHSRPKYKATASITFDDFMDGVETVRKISQAGLYPTNCRLLDPEESISVDPMNPITTLVVGFESGDHPVDTRMSRALEIAKECKGKFDEKAVVNQSENSAKAEQEETAADLWKNAFIRLPYYKNHLIRYGIIGDTFETSITWEKFGDFYRGIKSDISSIIKEATGYDGLVSCRFTHVYPDGPAVYISFLALGDKDGNMKNALDNWCKIKQVANTQVVARGGTVTHHHAVGRDHRGGYEKQMPPLFLTALGAAKESMDPQGVLNPGVLIDPVGKSVGITGAMQDYPVKE